MFTQAVDLEVDMVVVAGDIFEMPQPPGSCVACLRRNVDMVKELNIPVLGIEGNHDLADEAGAWLNTCGIVPLDNDKPSIMHIRSDEHVPPVLSVAGLDYYKTNELLERLQQLADYAIKRGEKIDVLVLHCSVAEMSGYRGVELTAERIAAIIKPTGCRVVLMGDIHDGQQLYVDDILFSYSGSPEMTALDENPGKTFSVVEITPDKVGVTLYPIPNRAVVHYHVGKEEDIDRLLGELETYKGKNPLFVVSFDRDIPDCRKRVKNLVDNRCLYRLIPNKDPNAVRLDIVAQLSQQSFERKGAITNLRDIVINEFHYAEDGDEYQLIMQLMNDAGRATEICLNYAKSRGLQLVETFNM